jgi:GDP-L-fucose synthase
MKVLVTGGTGLLGSEVIDLAQGTLVKRSLESLNFCEKDGLVIHCAARVGGVKANTEFVADFFDDNVRLNMNVMEECRKRKMKLVSVLSTCVYPDAPYVKYPLTEDQLHMGPPHPSNFGYAYAKRMLDVQSRAYRQQHGCNFITVIPNNLYGINDNYDAENGHVIPALIRKFHEAKLTGKESVEVWGSGNPLREFTFARDAAKIILWLAENYDGEEPVNIGNTEQVSIGDLARLVAKIMKFEGEIEFNISKPEGQYQKPSSNEKLRSLGWCGQYTSLHDGLTETIRHFQEKYPTLRGL